MKKTELVLLLLCLGLLCGCEKAESAPTAESYRAEAEQAFARGDYAVAAASYQFAEERAPLDVQELRNELRALEELRTDAEERIPVYEALFASDAFTEEDYSALAALYLAAGQTREARETLEIGQCLSPSEDKSKQLEALTVELSDETEEVQTLLRPLFACLAREDTDGAVDALLELGVENPLLQSRLSEQGRRYGEGGAVLTAASGTLTLSQTLSGGTLRITLTAGTLSLAALDADGAFRTAVYKASNGSIVKDSGTVSGGVVSGAVVTETSVGEATELRTLWQEREAREFTVYTGELDAQGHATAAQTGSLQPGEIVYASCGDSYVYVITGPGETAESYVFTPATFGLK